MIMMIHGHGCGGGGIPATITVAVTIRDTIVVMDGMVVAAVDFMAVMAEADIVKYGEPIQSQDTLAVWKYPLLG
jgi:hypothetical protein